MQSVGVFTLYSWVIKATQKAVKGGALIVYDARTFREVARLDMKRPAGVFNVHNRAPRAHP